MEGRPPLGPGTPTETELHTLALFATFSHLLDVAELDHVSSSAIRKRLISLYGKLGATGHLDALNVLGWLQIPEEHFGAPTPYRKAGVA